MNIGLIGPAPPLRGGIAAHTAGLERALVGLGHRVAVLSYARVYPRLLYPGARVREPGLLAATELIDSLDPASWTRMRRWLEAGGFDRVVVEWWHPIVAPALLAGLPAASSVCVVVHNVVPHEWFPGSRALLRAVLARAQAVVCHSEHVAGELAAIRPRVPARVVPMPPLLDVALVLSRDRGAARERLGLPAGARVVAFAGHVRRYKGVDVLLEAWRRVREKRRDVHLVVAGEDYRPGSLRRRAAGQCDALHVVPRYLSDDELADVVACADCMVFPYLRASQSGLLPVARESGTRVVVSDVGGIGEQVRGYPRAAVVRAGDARGLADAIIRTLASAEEDRSVATRRAPQRQHADWNRLARICAGGEGVESPDVEQFMGRKTTPEHGLTPTTSCVVE